jgi:hypothetical protein
LFCGGFNFWRFGWQVEKNTIVDSSNDPVSQLQKIALFVKDSDREYVPTSLCFLIRLLSAVRCLPPNGFI